MILTRHADNGYLQQLLQAGASGYVLKKSASEELVRAIRHVAADQIYLDPAVMEHIVGDVVRTRAARGSTPKRDLSPREEEVLHFIAWGF